ncbi:MAG: sigma-70 family RNA polymerase sigma factor [Candidatus Limnocylindrales bacterium]
MDDRAQEAELVVAIAAGDVAAIEALYDRVARPLYALGLRWLGDVGEAEELVQETFVRAWRQADRFDPARGRVGAWLFGIARHIATDRWRYRGRRPTVALDESIEHPRDDGLADLGDAWDVALALEHLPPAQREVLVMAYSHDLSQSEIAGALGIPLGTVKSRTYYALRAMAELLDGGVLGVERSSKVPTPSEAGQL